MGSPPARRFLHSVILPHPVASKILLLQGPAGWALPSFESGEHYLGEVSYLNWMLYEQLGIEVTVRRCVRNEADPVAGIVRRLYSLVNHSPRWTPPPQGCWIQQHELPALRLAWPDQCAHLDEWFQEQDQGYFPPDGREWTLPQWWDRATAWIAQRLQQQGWGPPRVIEQVKAWEFSCVLYVRTDAGEFYFKAVPCSLARELQVTQRLAQLQPRWVAPIVAVEAQQRWLLMQAVGGPKLLEVADLSRWERAVETYACLQTQWVARPGELLALGCRDRRLETLAQDLGPLLADTAALLPGQPAGLSLAEIGQLRARVPQFRAMCHELAQYDIPPSLEHGDLWSLNIITAEDGVAFLDWDEACLAHPFFSLLELLLSLPDALAQAPEAQARIRAAYLRPWTPYESWPRLVRAFELAQHLAALHYAVSYWRVLPLIETAWELAEFVPYFLKRLLTERLSEEA
jgi:hypothetical protein